MMARDDGDVHSEMQDLIVIGLVYVSMKEFALADEYVNAGLCGADELKATLLRADGLRALGTIRCSTGRLLEGIEYYEKELKLARQIGDSRRVVRARCDIAQAQSALGIQRIR